MVGSSDRVRGEHAVLFVGAFVVGLSAVVAACSANTAATGATTNGTEPPASLASAGACTPCVQASDCNGGVCAQFGGDSYCAEACPTGSECGADAACMSVTGADGAQNSVCVPRNDACGASSTGAPPPSNGTCGSLAGPDVKASCTCSSTTKACQANGCFGGWWCDTSTSKCQAPPANCGSSNNGGAPVVDGAPPTGTIGHSGGTVSRLYFAVVGDTRPPTINDTSGYPTPIISKIYSDIQALSPRPSFAVATGDYVFSSGNGNQAAPQFDLYLGARAKFSNVVFPAMGNHECDGNVASNCGPGTTNGVTNNYQSFLSKMLQPIGQTTPNYVIDVNAANGSWTSKFVFVAGNAWTSADATWLEGVLAKPTTYTFIIRHEPKAAPQAPGCKGSEQIMAQHPYTLAIVGHTHTYGRTGPRQVTIGNGGAPLVGGGNYGFGLIQQRTDGAIQVDMVSYDTGTTDSAFRFALHPDGTAAP